MKVTETRGYTQEEPRLANWRDSEIKTRETQSRNAGETQKWGETPEKISGVVLRLRGGGTRECNYILVISID